MTYNSCLCGLILVSLIFVPIILTIVLNRYWWPAVVEAKKYKAIMNLKEQGLVKEDDFKKNFVVK